jgi:hypothetical protein
VSAASTAAAWRRPGAAALLGYAGAVLAVADLQEHQADRERDPARQHAPSDDVRGALAATITTTPLTATMAAIANRRAAAACQTPFAAA